MTMQNAHSCAERLEGLQPDDIRHSDRVRGTRAGRRDEFPPPCAGTSWAVTLCAVVTGTLNQTPRREPQPECLLTKEACLDSV